MKIIQDSMLGKRIVLIDDEPDILELLKFNLNKDGFDVITFGNPLDGLREIFSNPPDLVITDWLLPDMEGLEVCRKIKHDNQTSHLPVIMISCKSAESDLVSALEVGADDYLSKPFRMQELLARVRKRLVRPELISKTAEAIALENLQVPSLINSTRTRINDLIIDKENFEVFLFGDKLKLTYAEFKLLDILASNPGRVFSRAQLIESGFGHDYFVSERSVDVRIVNLRRKLGKYKDLIETIRSVGYRLNYLGI